MDYKPKHLQCPNCKQYIRGAVRGTRMDGDGITRKRTCECCGVTIITSERVVGISERMARNDRQRV